MLYVLPALTDTIRMWQQWVNGILGLWTIIVPFLGFTGNTLTWTLVVTGIIVAILGFWGGAQANQMTPSMR
jgi:hypothetical protein